MFVNVFQHKNHSLLKVLALKIKTAWSCDMWIQSSKPFLKSYKFCSSLDFWRLCKRITIFVLSIYILHFYFWKRNDSFFSKQKNILLKKEMIRPVPEKEKSGFCSVQFRPISNSVRTSHQPYQILFAPDSSVVSERYWSTVVASNYALDFNPASMQNYNKKILVQSRIWDDSE